MPWVFAQNAVKFGGLLPDEGAPERQLCRYTPNAIGIQKLAGHDGHLLVDPRYAKAILDCANGARDMGAVRVVIKDRHLAAIDEAAPQDVINAACRQRWAV